MPVDSSTLERMTALIDRWEEAHDRRAIFLSCYAQMTHNMLAGLAAEEFADRVWVGTLLDHFAGYYFHALAAFEQNAAPTPAVWHYAFTAAAQPTTGVLPNLFLGVNAHINYDLVLAVTDLLGPEWATLPAERRQGRYQDYCHVNTIITQTIDAVQDDVVDRYAPAMALVDTLMGPVDEWLVSQLITHWREEVWEHAMAMVETAPGYAREALRQKVEASALAWAHRIHGKEA